MTRRWKTQNRLFPLNKLVSADLECKSVYLAAFMSASVFVDCARPDCPPDSAYASGVCVQSDRFERGWGGVPGRLRRRIPTSAVPGTYERLMAPSRMALPCYNLITSNG